MGIQRFEEPDPGAGSDKRQWSLNLFLFDLQSGFTDQLPDQVAIFPDTFRKCGGAFCHYIIA